jgi:hypothetical protein
VLLPQQRVLALEGGQLLDLVPLAGFEPNAAHSAEPAVADLLAPAREHEGMNVERLGDILDLDAGKVAKAHSLALEIVAIAMDLSRTLDPGHPHLLER